MEWFRRLGRASRNLVRVARQNPVYAVQSLVFSPFRFARRVFRVLPAPDAGRGNHPQLGQTAALTLTPPTC